MNKMSKESKKYILIYSFIFVIFSLVVFFPFYSVGKSLIYDGDGFSQHYKALVYYSEYLREIVKNLFLNHKLIIPQWDFSIGEGFGVLETFHYYVIGDPIAFLSIFCPKEYIYVFYNVTVVLRIYLSGLAFSYLCFYEKLRNKYAILASSIAYAYCFWSLFNANRHIYFLNPMIYLPLVIVGVNKILNNEKPYLFAIIVAISCLSNFYFFYNIVLVTVIYVLIKLPYLYGKDFKQILKKLIIIAKYSIMGVLIGTIILLPTIYVFMYDSRVASGNSFRLYYPLSYYKKLVSTFFSTTRKYWLCMGYSAPIFFSIIVTLKKYKKDLFLVILILISGLIVICPLFGQIFNGFSYISNKWCFALSLLFAYLLAKQWEDIDNNRLILSILTIILIVSGIILEGLHLNLIIPLLINVAFILTSFIKNKRYNNLLKVSLVLIGTLFVAIYEYTPIGINYSSVSTSYEEDKKIFSTSEAYAISTLNDKEFFRYSGNNLTQNASIIFGTHSTDYYWSLTNSYTSQYRTDLELAEYSLYNFKEYDQRSALYSLSNVKYYINTSDNKIVPYGFSYLKTLDDYDLYSNDLYLPFGYTYKNSFNLAKWELLSSAEKEEAMTKAIIIESGNENIHLDSSEIEYKIIENDDIEVKTNSFNVNRKNARIKLEITKPENASIYISIKNIDFDDCNSWLDDKSTSSSINVYSNNISKSILCGTSDYRYYNGRTDFTINMGNKCGNVIEVEFDEKGKYSFDEIKIYSIPHKTIEDNIEKLAQDTLENIIFDTNKIEGNIVLDENKYLLLSIPYSKGWKAYVDGKEVELLNANVGYMALYLDRGNHSIELTYETPLLKIGCMVSCIGLILFICDLYINKKNISQ